MDKRKGPRKLLRAAIGVATISYVHACSSRPGEDVITSGNLPAPPAQGGSGGMFSVPPGSGGSENGGTNNANAGEPAGGAPAGSGGIWAGAGTAGNLVAPPPPADAGSRDAGNDADGGTPECPSGDTGEDGGGCDAGASE
jgi:hypothetical protein